MSSWKTTGLGLGTILAAVGTALAAYLDDDPESMPNIEILVTAITAGLGLIFARDNNVTSEKAGAA
jgi:putative effector of murein hydrolase